MNVQTASGDLLSIQSIGLLRVKERPEDDIQTLILEPPLGGFGETYEAYTRLEIDISSAEVARVRSVAPHLFNNAEPLATRLANWPD